VGREDTLLTRRDRGASRWRGSRFGTKKLLRELRTLPRSTETSLTNPSADCYLLCTAIIVCRVGLPKNTNAFRQIVARCSNYSNWPSPYCLSISRPIFRWLFTLHVYNYRRAAGWPIAIFSEHHSLPPYNFAKNWRITCSGSRRLYNILPAQYLSAIFHLTCAFDKWMSTTFA
jgi:hypothetical protein